MQKIGFSIVFLILLTTSSLKAQEWEFGMNVGSMGYIGDLNRNNPLKFTNPGVSVNVRYAFTPFSGLKLGLTQGSIQANDANSSQAFEKARNLSFSSNITELSLNYEYYFFPFSPGSNKERFTPYIFFGVAGFMFDPKAEFNGETYFLRELGTEGQGTTLNSSAKYSNLNVAIPFGIGAKYNFVDNFNLGFELGYRNTFTDYLDDISKNYVDKTVLTATNGQLATSLSDRSGEINNGINLGEAYTQRGDASRRDFYMFAGVSISYTLTPIKCPNISIYR